MTTDDAAPPARAATPALFVLAAFTGAALIFFVQPMVAKLVLPLLGGSPAVWNTSMAFFQTALLAGYGYAHLLQRLPTIRAQALVHLGVLVVAGLILPLRITTLMGEPSSDTPALWLLGVLFVSIGAPFAALSATAPLVQAWHARVFRGEKGEPYALYAASNLGSLIALLAYPILVEPTVTLTGQRLGWSAAYVVFILVMASLAWSAARSASPQSQSQTRESSSAVSWRDRLIWVALAAIPSSLMLGVTAHLATDVASAPFLWVVPLALYLLTFIIAFQTKPVIPPQLALLVQAAMLPACLYMIPANVGIAYQLFIHLLCFFVSALVCHQALVARRPAPARLTDFYLCLSLGGVIGGAFNAFAAPVIFNAVWEYPLALVLAAAARPWHWRKLTYWEIGLLLTAVMVCVFATAVSQDPPYKVFTYSTYDAIRAILIAAIVAAFLLRRNTPAFVGAVALLALAAQAIDSRSEVIRSDRSFFGVLKQSEVKIGGLGGTVRSLAHGTTLHGAQARNPTYRCRPLAYYAPETAMGQVFRTIQAERPAINIATIGLGTGTSAAYTRSADRLTFFEIDPLVVRLANDPANFSYTTECARGKIGFVIGDARLTIAKQPDANFDIILVDAFSSDAIPAHLLTREAIGIYLSKLKPDGVIILHLSNRHMELGPPAHASVKAAGGVALEQYYQSSPASPQLWESSQEVMIVGRTPQALQVFRYNGGWEMPAQTNVRPWTDDYMNLVGAIIDRENDAWDARLEGR